ncbi:MAG TPA: prolyl oligopeptidase family serine peptidase [Thermoanaerobaculia bacterium]|nr:prolyl oligopeptidase family serine peptidase [Thermoanaerobaculia bacterium]
MALNVSNPVTLIKLLVACSALLASRSAGQVGTTLGEPLPLELAVSLRAHNGRSPINLSPDGEWLAHTIQTAERIPRDSVSRRYSATGFPLAAEGDARMEATISNARTGGVVRLGGEDSSSWAPVWAPDGDRVAFYSDEGGTAGLWIWELPTRRSTRFPELIVRPFFFFETVQWTSDAQRLLVKVLPGGVSIAQANAREAASPGQGARFPSVAAGEPSVLVRRFDPGATGTDATRSPGAPGKPSWDEVDLVMVDLKTRGVTRLAERTQVRSYAWSPDEKYVAYTVMKASGENSRLANYDLVVQEIATGARRTLGTDLRMAYGIEWSWSPDSRTIAVISSGPLGSGEVVLFTLADGRARQLAAGAVPSFDQDEGEYPPLWDRDGEHLYAVGEGALWRIQVASGHGARVAQIPGWKIRSAVWRHGQPTIWSRDGGRTAWLVAREDGGARSGIFAVDLGTGEHHAVLQEPRTYAAVFNLAASDATGEIAFVSTGQQQLAEVWLFDTKTGETRQASRINQALDRYELGSARTIDWRTADGQALRGALLLPPGYQPGMRLPLVVWVYGGSMGSTAVNRFGLVVHGPSFNLQILATRGYAVLFPDAPVRTGMAMADLLRTVMPGVDAAIEQGYADPDRLAVMGQSYGAYCTLGLITQTTRFKAAVITAAVQHPDLFADYVRAIGFYERGQGNMGGSIWEHRDRYLDNSPLLRFDRIETPLLIGQGELDGDLVPTEAIFAALQRLEKPVEYRLYEGEGHVITRKPNVLDFWQRRLEFLAEHLDVKVDSKGAVIFDAGRARAAASRTLGLVTGTPSAPSPPRSPRRSPPR